MILDRMVPQNRLGIGGSLQKTLVWKVRWVDSMHSAWNYNINMYNAGETIEKESAPKRRRLVHVSALSRQQEPPGNQAGGAEEKPATLQASSKKLKLKILSKSLWWASIAVNQSQHLVLPTLRWDHCNPGMQQRHDCRGRCWHSRIHQRVEGWMSREPFVTDTTATWCFVRKSPHIEAVTFLDSTFGLWLLPSLLFDSKTLISRTSNFWNHWNLWEWAHVSGSSSCSETQ